MDKNVKSALYLLGLVVIIISLFVWNVVQQSHQFSYQEITVFPKTKAVSAFQLHDESDRPFNLKNLQGEWSVLFFGYTHCPDVCPTTMANLNRIYSKLKPEVQQKVQVIFVSVDPERDNSQQLKTYVEYFNKNFKGVTGSLQELTDFSRQLGGIFFKGEADKDGNYAVDHTSKVFLMNPQGERVGLFDGQIRPPATKFPVETLVKELNYLATHGS